MKHDSKMDIRIQCNRAVRALMEAEKLMSQSPEYQDSPAHKDVQEAFLLVAEAIRKYIKEEE